MKHFVAAFILLTSTSAHAITTEQCQTEVTFYFQKFKKAALKLVTPSERSHIDKMTIILKTIPPRPVYNKDGTTTMMLINGLATFKTGEIHLDPTNFCNEPAEIREFVVAHEIGHILSFAMEKNMQAFKVDPWTIEWLGNEYGAWIFKTAGSNSSKMLEVVDATCAKGETYSCERAEAWRKGLNR